MLNVSLINKNLKREIKKTEPKIFLIFSEVALLLQ